MRSGTLSLLLMLCGCITKITVQAPAALPVSADATGAGERSVGEQGDNAITIDRPHTAGPARSLKSWTDTTHVALVFYRGHW